MRLTGTRLSQRLHLLDAWPSSPTRSTVVMGAALLLIFVLDAVTGAAPVQHLYYLPIIFAGMRFGGRGGLSAALIAIVFYHLAKPRALIFDYAESDILQIAVFIAVGAIADRLTRDARRLHRLAMTDDLTGLHNLRSFEGRLRSMVRVACETETPLGLLVLDLDRLKQLNDVHGHLAGAEAVRTVGRILAHRLPPEAAACRYGGDEFVIGLPASGEPASIAVADDLCRAVNAAAPTLAGVAFPAGTLSISVGLACRTFLPSGAAQETLGAEVDAAGEALFRAADRALYLAKASGRNRISVG